MRESLDSDTKGQGSRNISGPLPKTHLLLVQSGVHTVFLGDFLTLIESFQTQTSLSFAADFWTMYSPQQYFENESNKRHTIIKFENYVMTNRYNTNTTLIPTSNINII